MSVRSERETPSTRSSACQSARSEPQHLDEVNHFDNCLNRKLWDQSYLELPDSVPTLTQTPFPSVNMASAVFFLDLKGKTLLARNYRGDIPMSAVEKFPILLSEAEEESSAVPPCFSDEGINVG